MREHYRELETDVVAPAEIAPAVIGKHRNRMLASSLDLQA